MNKSSNYSGGSCQGNVAFYHELHFLANPLGCFRVFQNIGQNTLSCNQWGKRNFDDVAAFFRDRCPCVEFSEAKHGQLDAAAALFLHLDCDLQLDLVDEEERIRIFGALGLVGREKFVLDLVDQFLESNFVLALGHGVLLFWGT